MSKSRNLNSDPGLSSNQLKLRIFVVTYIFIKPSQKKFGKKLYFSSKFFQRPNMLHSNCSSTGELTNLKKGLQEKRMGKMMIMTLFNHFPPQES